ncbi:hypothetical protein DAPPUDRAFT_313397 [Daphnia pulex]|uniref:Uncharacterized protein n=1 Tax=Daphnia pulex TaxID=6669 RepID=E9G454_DAPPU|nr:hypothetical protein DAPPUDRAFT_313397 [Daphnia pulex]|eukprot:EFX86070.1 hypothetical protein DAPPUDRAFT_313397 [Daphnia pulex]
MAYLAYNFHLVDGEQSITWAETAFHLAKTSSVVSCTEVRLISRRNTTEVGDPVA